MRRPTTILRALLVSAGLAGVWIAAPSNLTAQSIVRGEFSGTVREVDGELLDAVQITLTEIRTGTAILSETDDGGVFRFSLLAPGEYEMLAETRGFIPRLVTDIRVRPGQSESIGVNLLPAPPPVETVDTVSAGSSTASRFDGLGGRWLSAGELRSFPQRNGDLSGVGALHPVYDEFLGSEGLPGSTTAISFDGLMFTPARHPFQQGQAALPLFSLNSFAGVGLHTRGDVEWTGSGGQVALQTRRGAGDRYAEVFGSVSAGPLWSSDALSGLTAPTATSFWGGGALSLPIGSGKGQLFIGVEGLRSQTPQRSPVAAETAGRLAVSSPSLDDQDASLLVAPWVHSLDGISLLSRLDWRTEGESDISIRAAVSTTQTHGDEFFAVPLAYGSDSAHEGRDAFISGYGLTPLGLSAMLEVTAGVEFSERTWEGTAGTGSADRLLATNLLEDGSAFGPSPGVDGTVNRSAFLGRVATHIRWDRSWLKLGIAASFRSYDYEYAFGSRGAYVLSSPESIFLGDGRFLQTRGTIRSAGFSVPEVGVFAQHRWEPESGLRITTGLRFDYEFLPDGEAPLNTAWAFRAHQVNNAIRPGVPKLSPRVGVSWDLAGDGSTVLEAAVAATYDPFDPSAIAEVFVRSGGALDYRQVGGLGQWPAAPTTEGTASESGIGLTVFGPNLEAPRTARGSVGLAQRLGDRAVFSIAATYRQTEYLLRRTDVNLPIEPAGTLADGRTVSGTLGKAGRLVYANPGSYRRFAEFGRVWALNANGWSRYTGATLALDYGISPSIDLFAAYTYSSTEDNLVGARSSDPERMLSPNLGILSNDWDVGTSDFDLPHRFSGGARAELPILEGTSIAAVYRFQSGWPFTAGYQAGVDVNADGAAGNDPALVPTDLPPLAFDAACLNADLGALAKRNACRGPASHTFDLHLEIGLTRVRDSVLSLTADAFNLTDAELGTPDRALLLLDEDGSLGEDSSGRITLPTEVNPSFGQSSGAFGTGRLFRVGLRLGLPR